ncbi:unnamed protein product, partial [Phaeothamnion confervicola]
LFVIAALAALYQAAAFVLPASAFNGAALASQVGAAISASQALEMRTRICDLTGKRANRKARVVTFSHTRNHKVQEVNLQEKRIFWTEGK